MTGAFELDGRIALVTGGSRGIGLAIARAYVDAGASVALIARDATRLQEAAAALPADRVLTVTGDVADRAAADRAVVATLERWGRLDVLVNNAATSPYFGPLIGAPMASFERTLAVNVGGPLAWAQAAWSAWMGEHGGAIVNVASIGGVQGEPNVGAYNVSKAALLHLTTTLAAELGPGVRVNAVAPGLVPTTFSQGLVDHLGDDYAGHAPLRRVGRPEDVAGAAVYLASDAAAWVTGTVLVVDGGWLASSRQRVGGKR